METTIRTATGGIAEEYRKMKVGDVVAFPVPKYNYNTIRQTPQTSCLNESMEGRKWTTRKDFENKCIIVTRLA